jgi:hypothetical protein
LCALRDAIAGELFHFFSYMRHLGMTHRRFQVTRSSSSKAHYIEMYLSKTYYLGSLGPNSANAVSSSTLTWPHVAMN